MTGSFWQSRGDGRGLPLQWSPLFVHKFASDRVRKSVLDEFRGKGFKLENGEFVGGKEFLEGLKQSEPSVFAADEKPGLFMGSTQSNVGADANNLESQIYAGMGFKK